MSTQRLFTPFALLTLLILLLAACGGAEEVVVTRTTQDEAAPLARPLATQPPREIIVEVTRVVEVEGEVVVETVVEERYAGDAADAEYETFATEPVAPPLVLPPPQPTPETMILEDYGVNPFLDVEDDPLSTFAVDVDTGAYTLVRRYLTDGIYPPPEAVRVEEFVNYFDQQYAGPEEGGFRIDLEAAPAPYGESDRYHLVRIGIQGYELSVEERPDLFLIFVVDVSGSMGDGNRIDLVRESLRHMVAGLRDTDRIAIVAYDDSARILLGPTYVVANRQIDDAIGQLRPGGSTNAEAGLSVGYRLADEYAQPWQNTRLILFSDGVANVGNTTPETILTHARAGIPLNAYGFGLGNYNDVLMEQLADQGDGSYAYIDDYAEIPRVFGSELSGSLITIARDAKIQVAFNPAVVERYRLLGFENRDVADEDFRNDAVDAGEIGAGHSVTALYEIKLAEEASSGAAAFTVTLRYLDPDADVAREQSASLAPRDFHSRYADASPTFQLSAVVAEFAEILRESYWAQENSLDALLLDARRVSDLLPADPDVSELVALIATAASLPR